MTSQALTPVLSQRKGRLSDTPKFLEHLNPEVQTMPISEQLLEILVCPACRAKVELKPDGSGLKCVECKRVYPIRDDIPVMLIDEAKIEEEE